MGLQRKSASDSFNEIASVRIELRHTDPPIWREVEVPTSITLLVLHDIIQAVMGWFDYHLWEFNIDRRKYGLAMDEDWGGTPRSLASHVRLRDVLKPSRTVIDYTYDLGDCWEHRLSVTDVRTGKPGVLYPRYVGGERNGPPEDCGGISGFYEWLEALLDPQHERLLKRKNGRTNTTQMRLMSCRSSTLSAASPIGGTLPECASPRTHNRDVRAATG